MIDHDGVEPVPEASSAHPSRRSVLRAGLFALAATHLPDGLVSRASAQEARPGLNLVGKLEGAEVVVDPARFPKAFKEAPPLAELVKAGKLPPVQERIGQDPLVVKPLREIGKYGGTWRRGFTGPFDTSNGHRAAQNDKLLYWDYSGTKLVPNIARAWEVSPDGKITTVHLRRGMKWSDGAPFTADDFVFWFDDVYSNKELVPVPLSVMTINGKPIAIRKVDVSTVQLVAPEPYYALPTVLASVWGIATTRGSGATRWAASHPRTTSSNSIPSTPPGTIWPGSRRSTSSRRGSRSSRAATTPAATPTCRW
jgi:peptide/nickel transport system substrate-binding protein